MQVRKPKWLAIGKQQIGLDTKSLLEPPRKRIHSQSHSSLGRSASLLTVKSSRSLARNKSSFQLLSPELLQQIQRAQREQGLILDEITINILSQEQKSGQQEKDMRAQQNGGSAGQLTKDYTGQLLEDKSKQLTVQEKTGSINFQEKGKEILQNHNKQANDNKVGLLENSKSITMPCEIQSITSQLKIIDKIIQSHLQQPTQQQLTLTMSHNHVPFYLRNQEYAQYLQEPSEPSVEEIPFGQELNQSVVLEAEDLSMDIMKNGRSKRRLSSNANDEQSSEIIEQMSFADSSMRKDANDLQPPIIHYANGYMDRAQNSHQLRPPIPKQSVQQHNSKKFIAKTKLQLHQLAEMTQNLRIIHETILKELQVCQTKGKIPLFLRNTELHDGMMNGFKEILLKYSKAYADKQLNRQNESIGKLLNAAIEKGLLGEGQFREMDSGKKITKMIGRLEDNAKEIAELRDCLNAAETQCEKTSSVLLNKLEQVNSLKQELARLQSVRQQASRTALTVTFSPEFEKNLREKEIRHNEMTQQIESLKQRNEQLMDEKQKLQQQVFTLEQKIIGVEMEVQQRVRQGIQQIRPAIQQQLKTQFLKQQTSKQATGSHEFFLQTIDTLSQQIKDLTQKCKYYQNHIHNQQKPTPKPSLHQQHEKDLEQLIAKRISELDMRENTLLKIETELTFKDKKLKELQFRVNRQASVVEKREKQCVMKEEEVEKYLQELNAREEELYGWEKQLAQEEKKLTRKLTDLQRDIKAFESQRNTHHHQQMISPYTMAPVIQSRNIMSPQYMTHNHQYSSNYSTSITPKQPISTSYNIHHQAPPSRTQFDRPYSYHHVTEPTYEPNYEDDPSMQNNKISRSFERTNHHNMSQQYIRYNRLNDSSDVKSPEHMDHSDLDITEMRQNRLGHKTKTQSMRINGNDSGRSNAQGNHSKVSQYRMGAQKLYLSSTYDKKTQMVEEILARRRNDNSMINNRNNRAQSRSPISVNRGNMTDMFKKPDARNIRSPIKTQTSFHNIKQVTERKLKERYERKKMYEKPSKDMSDFYRPVNPLSSPTSVLTGKKYPYDFGHETSGIPEKQYTPRSFMKGSIPAADNISEKLQKLKEQIKREVRDLE